MNSSPLLSRATILPWCFAVPLLNFAFLVTSSWAQDRSFDWPQRWGAKLRTVPQESSEGSPYSLTRYVVAKGFAESIRFSGDRAVITGYVDNVSRNEYDKFFDPETRTVQGEEGFQIPWDHLPKISVSVPKIIGQAASDAPGCWSNRKGLSGWVFDRNSGDLVAIYLGSEGVSSLVRDVAATGAYFRTSGAGTRDPNGSISNRKFGPVVFRWDRAAWNSVKRSPGSALAVGYFISPEGGTIYLSQVGGSADWPIELSKSTGESISEVFTSRQGNLRVFPAMKTISAPHGIFVLDAPNFEANVIKRDLTPTTVNVRAFYENKGVKFYVSDWSYDRISKGEKPNYMFLNTGETYSSTR